jgi:hypothetical protein
LLRDPLPAVPSPRSPLGSPDGWLSQLRHACGWEGYGLSHVPRAYLCGVGLASPPVAHHLRQVREEHLNLPTCLLAHASQPRSRVRGDDVSQRFTCVDPRTRSSSPTALMLAVAAVSHDEAASPKAEDTLSQG